MSVVLQWFDYWYLKLSWHIQYFRDILYVCMDKVHERHLLHPDSLHDQHYCFFNTTQRSCSEIERTECAITKEASSAARNGVQVLFSTCFKVLDIM